MKRLEGKVAIVTGAARGLGREYALALAASGASLVVNDVGSTEETVAAIRAGGGQVAAHSGSVADWVQARQIVETALKEFGRLDIVVNNAGIVRYGAIGEMDPADWDAMIGVNLTGAAAVSHWAAKHWRQSPVEGGRAIINISSPAGIFPRPGSPGYMVSKAGIAAATIALSQELAPFGVRVNAIAPLARTEILRGSPNILAMMPQSTGFDRHHAEHVAPVVVYLASSACRLIGRVIGVEGDTVWLYDGWTAEHELSNHGAQWTVDQLAAAFETIPIQQSCWELLPGARIPAKLPADETINILRTATNM